MIGLTDLLKERAFIVVESNPNELAFHYKWLGRFSLLD
jgi:hypothetical protein